MAKSIDWRTVLAPDIVQQIEDEMERKFSDGWYACERALQEAIRAIAPPPEVRGRRLSEQNGSTRSHAQARAPRGFWDELILEVLKGIEPDRLAYTDLMTRVQRRTEAHKLARSSFNVSLERLEREGRIGKEDHWWFWRGSDEVGAPPSGAGADADDKQLATPSPGDGSRGHRSKA